MSGLCFLLPQEGTQEGKQQGGGGQEEEGETPKSILPAGFVQVLQVPEGGRHPRVAVGAGGVALLSFRGDGEHGDLFACRSSDEGKTFTAGVRVNARAGSVAADQGVHNGGFDLGPDGKMRAVWVSTDSPRSLCYARENESGEFGEEQVLGTPEGLGSACAIAVGGDGKEYVFYSALGAASPEDSTRSRYIYLCIAESGTFSEAIAVDDKEHFGVSEHSGISAHVDSARGAVYALYRMAFQYKNQPAPRGRGVRLISSSEEGGFKGKAVDDWTTQRDPHALTCLAQHESTTLAAWATSGQVYWSHIRRGDQKVSMPISEPKRGRKGFERSAPAVAANNKNAVLLVWLEHPANGSPDDTHLAWQIWLYDSRQFVDRGKFNGPITGTSPAVFARSDGGFTIVY